MFEPQLKFKMGRKFFKFGLCTYILNLGFLEGSKPDINLEEFYVLEADGLKET